MSYQVMCRVCRKYFTWAGKAYTHPDVCDNCKSLLNDGNTDDSKRGLTEKEKTMSEKITIDKVLTCLAFELPEAVYNDPIPLIREELNNKDALIKELVDALEKVTYTAMCFNNVDTWRDEDNKAIEYADHVLAKVKEESNESTG